MNRFDCNPSHSVEKTAIDSGVALLASKDFDTMASVWLKRGNIITVEVAGFAHMLDVL